MGLFINNKKLCPICGNATPRLLATKIENTPICYECAEKIDMRQDKLETLTLDEFEEYLEYYRTNQRLRRVFHADYEKCMGMFKTSAFMCDTIHHTFKVSRQDNATVYGPENFVSLVIYQDETPVIELTRRALIIHDTGVTGYIESLEPEIEAYYGNDETSKRLADRETGTGKNTFDYKKPFKKWNIALTITHEWGEGITDSDSIDWMDERHPSVEEGISRYNAAFNEYRNLALVFRQTCCPDCPIEDELGA